MNPLKKYQTSYKTIFKMVKLWMKWNDAKTKAWMDIHNPLLGGLRPLDMITSGRGEWLRQLIETMIEENNHA